MGNLVFQATLGGQVNLVGPNTASTFNINVPTVNGNMVTTGDTGTVTNTMCATSVYTAPGTIGSGTPNTGAFTTLSASGVASFAAGSASAPALTRTGDTNTGIFFPAADTIAFAEGGTEVMRLDSSGNLGVGTSSPNSGARLTLSSATTDAQSLSIDSTNTNGGRNGSVIFRGTYGAGGGGLFDAAIISRVNIDDANSSANSQALAFYTKSGTSAPAERARIDASGNWLLGTTTTLTKATVFGTGDQKLSLVSPTGSSTQVGINLSPSMTAAEAAANPAQAAIYATDSSYSANIIFATKVSGALGNALTDRARIATSGSFIVGPFDSDVINARTSAAAGNGRSLFTGWHSATTPTNGTLAFNVTSNGNVTNINNSYGAISDAKLKENIVDATPKLADLMRIQIRNYNLIGSAEKQLGVVAQELEQVFPKMVEETPDFQEGITTDEKGNEITGRVATGTTTKSVKYSVFVPMLIKAMQEQQAIITQLQSDIEALKAPK